jgi:cell wall-associated NlpC family hydrolase
MPAVGPDGQIKAQGVTFEQFFAAEAQQESGGNYNSVNSGSGALGKYQIMPANIPGWSQKYMGVTWSAAQFLGDPAKQDALARAVLQDYFNQWGARGAASAWYSGNPALNLNYGSQNGGPSIGSYVDSVIAIAMGKPATGGGSTGGTPPAPPPGPYTGPTTTTDNTVKPPPPPAAAPGTSGMGALSANGIDAVSGNGAGAFTTPDANALTTPGDKPVAPSGVAPALSTASGTTAATGSRGQAVNAALKYLGTPYVFGGGNSAGPTKAVGAAGNLNAVGFDCSGLTEAALAAAGITSSHSSFDQLMMGPRTAISSLQPGDLVGMNDGGHVGIYAGNNQIIVADHNGTNVQQRAIGANEGAYGVSLAGLYK